MIYGTQDGEYKVWLIGANFGANGDADEYGNAIKNYAITKNAYKIKFIDSIVLDMVLLGQMRMCSSKEKYAASSYIGEVVFLRPTN